MVKDPELRVSTNFWVCIRFFLYCLLSLRRASLKTLARIVRLFETSPTRRRYVLWRCWCIEEKITKWCQNLVYLDNFLWGQLRNPGARTPPNMPEPSYHSPFSLYVTALEKILILFLSVSLHGSIPFTPFSGTSLVWTSWRIRQFHSPLNLVQGHSFLTIRSHAT